LALSAQPPSASHTPANKQQTLSDTLHGPPHTSYYHLHLIFLPPLPHNLIPIHTPFQPPTPRAPINEENYYLSSFLTNHLLIIPTNTYTISHPYPHTPFQPPTPTNTYTISHPYPYTPTRPPSTHPPTTHNLTLSNTQHTHTPSQSAYTLQYSSVPHLPCGGNNRCIILVKDVMVEDLQVDIGHAQQCMLLKVIEWVWTFILGWREAKERRWKGGRGREREGG